MSGEKVRVCRPTAAELAYALDVCQAVLVLLKQTIGGGKPNPETVITLVENLYELDRVLVGGPGFTVEKRREAYERRMADMLETPLYDENPTFIEVDG